MKCIDLSATVLRIKCKRQVQRFDCIKLIETKRERLRGREKGRTEKSKKIAQLSISLLDKLSPERRFDIFFVEILYNNVLWMFSCNARPTLGSTFVWWWFNEYKFEKPAAITARCYKTLFINSLVLDVTFLLIDCVLCE